MNISIYFCGVLHFFLSPCFYLSVWYVISSLRSFFFCFLSSLPLLLCINFLSMNLTLTVDIFSASNLHNECQYEIMFVGTTAMQFEYLVHSMDMNMNMNVCECIFLFANDKIVEKNERKRVNVYLKYWEPYQLMCYFQYNFFHLFFKL